jgi:hypothetical protein
MYKQAKKKSLAGPGGTHLYHQHLRDGGRRSQVWDQLGYIVRPCLKTKLLEVFQEPWKFHLNKGSWSVSFIILWLICPSKSISLFKTPLLHKQYIYFVEHKEIQTSFCFNVVLPIKLRALHTLGKHSVSLTNVPNP